MLSDKKATPRGGPASRPETGREAAIAGAKQGKAAPPRPPIPEQFVIDPESRRALEEALKTASETQSEVIIPELLNLKSEPLPDPANQPPQPIESLIQSGSSALPKEVESLLRGERQ